MTNISRMVLAACCMTAAFSAHATDTSPNAALQAKEAPTPTSEPTDVYIRRLAGLPASTAEGNIRVVDVGHHPMDTMVSIVASREGSTWRVSYVCAASPHCSKDSDHVVRVYSLDQENANKIDDILVDLQQGSEPGGLEPSEERAICGRLSVSINYQGFKRVYRRACDYGDPLTGLTKLLQRVPVE